MNFKKYLDEKGNMIAKCIVFQLAMSLFGIMITMTLLALNEVAVVLGGIFSILFYFALVGAAVNEDGVKDCIKVEGGRMEKDAILGLKYVAISYIPTFIISGLYCVLSLCGVQNSFTSILNLITRFFTTGMYMGLDISIFGAGETVAAFSYNGYSYLIYEIVSVIVLGLLYYAGLCGINLVRKKNEME